ncbi:hypothetical protein SRHO_G00147360 [Serrasalmus rhombeus]
MSSSFFLRFFGSILLGTYVELQVKADCKPGFSQSLYTLRLSADLLQDHTAGWLKGLCKIFYIERYIGSIEFSSITEHSFHLSHPHRTCSWANELTVPPAQGSKSF